MCLCACVGAGVGELQLQLAAKTTKLQACNVLRLSWCVRLSGCGRGWGCGPCGWVRGGADSESRMSRFGGEYDAIRAYNPAFALEDWNTNE